MMNFLLSRSHQAIAPAEQELIQWKVPDNRFGSYEAFLRTIQQQGYQFCFFNELRHPKREIVLRHDVDFDTNFALQSALIESKLGIKATYFFLLRSNFYNVLSAQDFENILLIREMGHAISVHFDPSIYEDIHKGLQWEARIFRDIFNQDANIVSLHRPDKFFQEFDAPISGIEHTYQSKYFRDIKYFADSTGVWRYGHPFDSPEFAQQKSLHILIHPIWWMLDGSSNLDKLRTYYVKRIDALKADFSDNCIPFRKIHESL